MIEPTVFFKEMKVLEAWFGQKVELEHSKMMLTMLEKHLSTAEFKAACQAVMEQWDRRYIPPPSVFVEKVKGKCDPAMIAWAQLIRAIVSGEPITLDAKSEFALQSMGGFRYLDQSPVRERSFLRQEFMRYYEAAGHVSSLPQSRTYNLKAIAPASSEDGEDFSPEQQRANTQRVRRWLAIAQEVRKLANGVPEDVLSDLALNILGSEDWQKWVTPEATNELLKALQNWWTAQSMRAVDDEAEAGLPTGSPAIASEQSSELEAAPITVPPLDTAVISNWLEVTDDSQSELEVALDELGDFIRTHRIPEYDVDQMAGKSWRSIDSVLEVEQLKTSMEKSITTQVA